jgi:hypothetical protein
MPTLQPLARNVTNIPALKWCGVTNKRDTKMNQSVSPVALVEIEPQSYVMEVYRPFHDRLETAIKQADAAVYDINTRGGMNLALQMRALFRGIRLDGEKQRKKFKAPFIETGKLLDSKYAELEAKTAQYEISFDEDIKAKEKEIELAKAAEAERVAHIQALIDGIKIAPLACLNLNSDQINQSLNELDGMDISVSVFGDRYTDALAAFQESIKQVKAMLEGKKASEEIARQQEAARLESERVAREAAEAKAIADAEARKLQETEAERIRVAGAELKRLQDELAKAQAEVKAQQQAILDAELAKFNEEQEVALAAKIAREREEAQIILDSQMAEEERKFVAVAESEQLTISDDMAIAGHDKTVSVRQPSTHDLITCIITCIMHQWGVSEETACDWILMAVEEI